MKSLLFFFCSLLLFLSCQGKSSLSSAASGESEEEMTEDTFPKATTIFWVDKKSLKFENGVPVRTAKARATINSDGKISLHSFVKDQPLHVRRYLSHRLTIFRVTKIMMDSGYVKPGEQYVQLRYFPELAGRFK